jgi:hypothetical protein
VILPRVHTGAGSLVILLGSLTLILAAQLAFKMRLEAGTVLGYCDIPAANYERPWTLLLPVDLHHGHVRWSPTGLVITTVLNRAFSAETTIVLLASLLTVVSFATSWLAFRSHAFTITFTTAMAFGTQFNYAWVNSSCTLYYLFVAYALVNLLCLFHLLMGTEAHRRIIRIGFVCSLIALALCWETWLDYFMFLVVLCAVGGGLAWRHRRLELLRPLSFVACSALAVVVPYLAIRITFGGTFNEAGSESELLIRHTRTSLMIEDLYSNVVTYLYIAWSNFVPPWILSSHAEIRLSDAELVLSQNGYHPDAAHFVAPHYHYLWYFQAGMVAIAFTYLTWQLLSRSARRPSVDTLCLLAMCLLVWTGFGTHALIKFRPYLSVPVLAYKATLSILGVALIISFAVMHYARSPRAPARGTALTTIVCSVILLGAFTRPYWQWVLLQKLNCAGPPDPMVHVNELLKR